MLNDKRRKIAFLIFGILVFLGGLYVLYGYFFTPLSADEYVQKINEEFRQSMIDSRSFSNVITTADKAIKTYPDRLDLRFGKIFVCKFFKDTNCMAEELINITKHSAQNLNHWQWLNEETKDQNFMLENIIAYEHDLFTLQADTELEATAHTVLQYYPDNFQNLNMLGVLYILRNDLSTGEIYLKKAQALAPDDQHIKNNLQELEARKKALSAATKD